MSIADLFDVLQGVAQPATPYFRMALSCKPQGKKAHESRWVPPNPAKGRFKGFIHNYTPKQTEDYQKSITEAAELIMGNRPPVPAGRPIAMRLFVMIPIPKSWSRKEREAAIDGRVHPTVKPDDDNYCKALDALNGVVWEDDCQRVRTLIVKEYAEKPGIIVEVYLL